MTPLNATADFAVEQPTNHLLTPEQAPRPESEQSVDMFAEGLHEAVITIVNRGAVKEQVEEVVLTRQNHLRSGESVSLIERGGNDVIHQQFHTLVSVQAILADLNHRGIHADVQINWGN